MSNIKSEKAKEFIRTHNMGPRVDEDGKVDSLIIVPDGQLLWSSDAIKAVIIAETELSELHAQQLQEVKDRAVYLHRNNCPNKGDGEELDDSDVCYANDWGQKVCDAKCAYMEGFLAELNK